MREVTLRQDASVEGAATIPEGWTILHFGADDDGHVLLHCVGPDDGPEPTLEPA